MESNVEALIPLFAIFAIFIAFPWIILNFLSRKRDAAIQAAGDPTLNATLTGLADKLERRIEAIEGLLDQETPGWRRGQPPRSER